jgi:hypothetical protein
MTCMTMVVPKVGEELPMTFRKGEVQEKMGRYGILTRVDQVRGRYTA